MESRDDGLLEEVVQLRPASGRVRYLLQVRREPCSFCATGTRTISLWATGPARGEAVAWCCHCFNATCERVDLSEEQRTRYRAIVFAVAQGRVSRPWAAVRPALEDLERRGLL